MTSTSKLQDALVPFQQEDVDFLSTLGRGLACHKTGLGKTVILLAVRERLLNASGRTLVVGSTSACAVWASLIPEWTNERPTVVEGTTLQRKKLWDKCAEAGAGIWACTYDIVRLDLPKWPRLLNWDMIICDEVHKIRNKKTQRYKAMLPLRSKYLLGASATVVDRGPQDLWSFLHLLDRKKFSSYWAFAHRYCWVEGGQFGGTEVLGVKNAEDLRKVVGQYAVRRTWEQVGMQLPALRRAVIELDMTPNQVEAYYKMQEDLLIETEHGVVVTPTILANLTRLRQIATFPQLLGIAESGCMMNYLIDALEDDPHTVVFTPFAQALPLIKDRLESEGYKNVYQIRGGMKSRDLNNTIAAFKASRGIMLCSIQFAESFALDTVNTAYFAGFEWSPDYNTQAEGRLRRLNSVLPLGVSVQYLLPKGTVYEQVREVLNGKTFVANQVLRMMRGG